MFKQIRTRGLRLRWRGLAALTTAVSVTVPAIALAASGPQAAPAAAPQPAAAPAPAGSLKVSAAHHVLTGRKAPVKGALSSRRPGVGIVVQTPRGSGWHAVARTRTKAGGRFAAAWRPAHAGSYSVRVVAAAPGVKPWRVAGRVHAYRPVSVSYYGPGLYGSHLACGGSLTPGKLGVANKSLPCGTRVTLRYKGRSVTVPVIDRGPYVAGREYDLTTATKDRLGFGSTGMVWSTK